MRAQVILSMQTNIDLPDLPASGAVLDEVVRELVEPIVSGDDLVVLAEQSFEQRGLIRVEVGLVDCLGDAIVEVEAGDAQLFAAVLVDELHGGVIFFGSLEVVARNVVAEDASGQVRRA